MTEEVEQDWLEEAVEEVRTEQPKRADYQQHTAECDACQ